MSRLKDLTGLRFNQLEVLSRAENYPNGKSRWLCRCDCGNTTVVSSVNLRFHPTKSCGCRKRKAHTHGQTRGRSKTRAYCSWQSMRDRCLNSRSSNYQDYGGRGILVYEKWASSFEEFFKDMGIRPKGTTLDRVDVNGNYEPNNCRWATPLEQARNQRPQKAIESFSNEEFLKEFKRRFPDCRFGD